jgi:hypothetical protein
VADHPLRPATRPRLGRPLPYQLADGTRAYPRVLGPYGSPAFPTAPFGAVGSCGISDPFGSLSPARGQVTHALLTRLPLDIQSSIPSALRLQGLQSECLARLACLNHAASVRSEPGSNSPLKKRICQLTKLYVHSNIEQTTGCYDPGCQRAKLSKKQGHRRRRPKRGTLLFAALVYTTSMSNARQQRTAAELDTRIRITPGT